MPLEKYLQLGLKNCLQRAYTFYIVITIQKIQNSATTTFAKLLPLNCAQLPENKKANKGTSMATWPTRADKY